MSDKKHCDTCDATKPANDTAGGLLPGHWIVVTAENPNERYRTAAGVNSKADRIKGDYCSPLCLATRIARVDSAAMRDAILSTDTLKPLETGQ